MSPSRERGPSRVGDLVLGPGELVAVIVRSTGDRRLIADIEYFVVYWGSLARGALWDHNALAPFPLLSR